MVISTESASLVTLVLGAILLARVDGTYTSDLRLQLLERRVEALQAELNSALEAQPIREKRALGGRRARNIVLNGHLASLLGVVPTPEVGFHVSQTKNKNYVQGDTIMFDDAATNLGGAFSKTDGQFTCSVSGTYLFNLNILSDNKSYIEAAIMRNETPVFRALSYNKYGTWSQGGGTVILRLSVNDVIKVKMVAPKSGSQTLLGGFSDFSGYLLKAA